MKIVYGILLCLLSTSLMANSITSYSSLNLRGEKISVVEVPEDIIIIVIANRHSSKLATDIMRNIGKQVYSIQKNTSIRFISIIDLSDILWVFHPVALSTMNKQYEENIAFFSDYYTKEERVFKNTNEAEKHFKSIIDFIPEKKLALNECKTINFDDSCLIIILDTKRNVFYSKTVKQSNPSITSNILKKLTTLVNNIENHR
jgi:hypothetical protein